MPLEQTRIDREATSEETFLQILDEATAVLDRLEVPYGLIGGIASAVEGRPRWTNRGEDIDVFVRHKDAMRALEALAEAGFETEETNENWIYKGAKDGVLVDVIFRSTGDIYLDDEMAARIQAGEFRGRVVKLIPPEDVLIMKAVAHGEETPQYWHDALSVLARADIDWNYLLRRARQHGARRVLSLLIYAQSNDLVVPPEIVAELFDMVQPR
ncbi:MAG TPA: nucleotidyltransferase [Actinomycetota bacterium]|nr:nucleotidyltransferase [Actinomycetota bacterium]